MHDPRLLLLDEPTVGLDPAVRRDLLDYVLALCRRRGLGVLWATHLVEEAERADRVVILHRGRVIENATPTDVRRRADAPSLSDAFLAMFGSRGAADIEARANPCTSISCMHPRAWPPPSSPALHRTRTG